MVIEKGKFYWERYKNIIFYSKNIRTLSYYIYRLNHHNEKESIAPLFKRLYDKSLVAFALPAAHIYEHVKLIFDKLYNKSNKYIPIVLGPTLDSHTLKETPYEKIFKDNYNLEYYHNIIPHPWTFKFPLKLIIETSLNTYGVDTRTPRVMYGHGMAALGFSKDYYSIKYIQKHKALLLVGAMQKKALEIAAKYYNVKLPPMYEIGYLRGDKLLELSQRYDRSNFLNRYGLENLPVVTYAPTWGFFSSLDSWFDTVISTISQMDVNLILRLHPLTIRGKNALVWKEKIEQILKQNKRIRVAWNDNIDDILLSTDVLITDVSGLGIEFMTLGKPVSFLPAPLYFKLYGYDRPESWVLPSPMINNGDALKRSIMNQLRDNTPLFDSNELVYNRSKSLDAMFDVIALLME